LPELARQPLETRRVYADNFLGLAPLGLSFARQVALVHGGSICALDAPEGGANLRMVI
jgi:signal transduction histidine kinase